MQLLVLDRFKRREMDSIRCQDVAVAEVAGVVAMASSGDVVEAVVASEVTESSGVAVAAVSVVVAEMASFVVVAVEQMVNSVAVAVDVVAQEVELRVPPLLLRKFEGIGQLCSSSSRTCCLLALGHAEHSYGAGEGM